MKIMIALLLVLNACIAQPGEEIHTPAITSAFYQLGDRKIEVKIFRYGNNDDIVYVNLHDDEQTSIKATQRLLEKTGGLFLKIENQGLRNIRFRQGAHHYTFDPNRMFSRTGIHQTLMNHGRSGESIISSIDKFGKWFIALLPKDPQCIIALHNNTDGRFSVESYLSKNDRARDAKAVHINPQHDPDDFFLTTDSSVFSRLAKENFNIVLQNNRTARKDGSLSIWCGENKMSYLNCETEHGNFSQYSEMIASATRNISVLRPAGVIVAFKSELAEKNMEFKDELPVWFGEKKVGMVVNADASESGNVSGQIAFEKSFPLYSNMDFFLLKDNNGPPRLEVRIDPTRKKQPMTATILNFKYRKTQNN